MLIVEELFAYLNVQDMTLAPEIPAAKVAKAVIPTTCNTVKILSLESTAKFDDKLRYPELIHNRLTNFAGRVTIL